MLNSIWDYRFAVIPALLASVGTLKGPVLLLPHGELEPGVLALKANKKRLGGLVLRWIYRRSVVMLGATSSDEATNTDNWFRSLPVITTGNHAPDAVPWGEPSSSSTSLRVVCISRIHPTKGLLPLLLGLSQATAEIRVHIVGPVEDTLHWQECQKAISKLPATVTVVISPLVTRDEIPTLFWNSDCLVLLTAGENYGHVIAEALQAGCPVIATPTTPWTQVLRGGGGDIVEDRNNPAEVAAVLDGWATKTPTDLVAARQAARQAYETFAATAGPNIIELALESLGEGTGGPPHGPSRA